MKTAEYKGIKGKVLFFGEYDGFYSLNLELTGEEKTALGHYPTASFTMIENKDDIVFDA